VERGEGGTPKALVPAVEPTVSGLDPTCALRSTLDRPKTPWLSAYANLDGQVDLQRKQVGQQLMHQPSGAGWQPGLFPSV